MVIMNGWLTEAATPSVTVAVKLKVPAMVGVPDRTPVAARLTPGGGAPLVRLQVKGGLSPVAVSTAL